MGVCNPVPRGSARGQAERVGSRRGRLWAGRGQLENEERPGSGRESQVGDRGGRRPMCPVLRERPCEGTPPPAGEATQHLRREPTLVPAFQSDQGPGLGVRTCPAVGSLHRKGGFGSPWSELSVTRSGTGRPTSPVRCSLPWGPRGRGPLELRKGVPGPPSPQRKACGGVPVCKAARMA